MKTSETINEIAAALSKAQGEMSGAKKGAENPFFKSKYSDLSMVIEAISEPFSKNGLCYVQGAEFDENLISVTTRIIHNSGQWIESTTRLPPTKNDAQGYGSAITYAKRYGLQALCGVPSEDDDANNAVKHKASKKRVASVPKEHREEIDKIVNALFIANENQDSLAANEVWSELSQQEQTWAWSKIPNDIQENLRKLIEG